MKGFIFNTLEEVISEESGLEAWEKALQETGLEGIYSSIGSYPDDEFLNLLAAYTAPRGLSSYSALRWYGEKAFPHFAGKFRHYIDEHNHARDFILTLNDIIHPEVRKLYPGASVPHFIYQEPDANSLVLIYDSPKKLCAFAEGLITGAASHYGTPVRISQSGCMLKGDINCHIHIDFLTGRNEENGR